MQIFQPTMRPQKRHFLSFNGDVPAVIKSRSGKRKLIVSVNEILLDVQSRRYIHGCNVLMKYRKPKCVVKYLQENDNEA